MSTENFPYEGAFSDEPITPDTDTIEQQEKLNETLDYVAEEEDKHFIEALEQLAEDGAQAIDESQDASPEVVADIEAKVNKKARLSQGALFLIKIGTMAAPLFALAGSNIGCKGSQINDAIQNGGQGLVRVAQGTREFAGHTAMATLDEVGESVETANHRARANQRERTSYAFRRNVRLSYQVDSSGKERVSGRHSTYTFRDNRDDSKNEKNDIKTIRRKPRSVKDVENRAKIINAFKNKHKDDKRPIQ